jgi:hypothetical protein
MPRLSWSRKLTRTIVVKHGRPGELKTLADARALIYSLPARRQQRPPSQHAAKLLSKAAGSRAPQDIADTTRQLNRALASEGGCDAFPHALTGRRVEHSCAQITGHPCE